MALSAAEKQRRYRQKRDADPERRSTYLQHEREKYIKDKELGKKKQVKDMSAREHRRKKKEWRQYKQENKNRTKASENLLTPPGSPNPPLPLPLEDPKSCNASRQKSQSLRKRNREKSKLYRKVSLLEKQLAAERKCLAKYKKRFQREKGTDDGRERHSGQNPYGLFDKGEIADINILLNQYVVVEYRYDGQPYPGYVTDVSNSGIYCECMHRASRNNNDFYWPRKIKDECWYDCDSIIAIIPKPVSIEGSNSRSLCC